MLIGAFLPDRSLAVYSPAHHIVVLRLGQIWLVTVVGLN